MLNTSLLHISQVLTAQVIIQVKFFFTGLENYRADSQVSVQSRNPILGILSTLPATTTKKKILRTVKFLNFDRFVELWTVKF